VLTPSGGLGKKLSNVRIGADGSVLFTSTLDLGVFHHPFPILEDYVV
jgi:hypothetical protein